jgi:hypothetical protein
MGNSALNRNVVILDQKGKRQQSDVQQRFLSEIDFFRGVIPEKMVIKNNATNPLYQIDVSCGAILIEGSLITGIAVTIDVTVSGANGVDIGVEVNNTWYYIWLIYNPVSDIVAGLLSTNSSSPTLPSGYTKKRLVGSVRNNVSGNFLRFLQKHNVVHYDELSTTLLLVNAFTNSSYNTYDAVGIFPHIIASEIILICSSSDATGDNTAVVWVRPNGLTQGEVRTHFAATTTGIIRRKQSLPVRLLMVNSQFDYKVASASEQGNIWIVGYKLKLW